MKESEAAVMDLGKIDDPLDASFEAWPEEPRDLGRKFGELALTFSGLKFTPAALFRILRDQVSNASRFARITYLAEAIRIKLKILESQIGDVQDKVKKVQEDLEAPRFREAASVASEEAARAANPSRIEDFASVLVGSLTPNRWDDPQQDLATLIRDLAQLGDVDIHVLGLLRTTFDSVTRVYPNLNDPNAFTEQMSALRKAIQDSKMHEDDFYSTCSRLAGFGLALEVGANPSRMGLSERCYRPTRRGLVLLGYLDAVRGVGNAAK